MKFQIFALFSEVIIKKPEEFKIACLKEIQALFPGWENRNPFFAGFGNRETVSGSLKNERFC